MISFILVIHSLVCIGLVGIILMQSGRGGGLTEAFASAESVFGAKTNEFLIRGTTVFATIFLVTCISLAVMSAKKKVSIMPTALPAQSEEDAEKVVQQIIDEAKKNTVVLDKQVQTEEAVAETAPVQNENPAAPVEAVPVAK